MSKEDVLVVWDMDGVLALTDIKHNTPRLTEKEMLTALPDVTFALCTDKEEVSNRVQFEAFLAEHYPQSALRLLENSAWGDGNSVNGKQDRLASLRDRVLGTTAKSYQVVIVDDNFGICNKAKQAGFAAIHFHPMMTHEALYKRLGEFSDDPKTFQEKPLQPMLSLGGKGSSLFNRRAGAAGTVATPITLVK